MKSNRLTHRQLLHSILRLMLRKGLKGLTMDLLASELSISKRTLYEIFGSKHQLISQTLEYLFGTLRDMSQDILQNSPDALSSLSEMFNLYGEMLCTLTIDFFKDMDTLYPEIHKIYKEKHSIALQEWADLYKRGIDEGVLRSDVNYIVLSEMMRVQMEALKRIEDKFLGKFTLEEIFTTVTTGFLHSIASEKGLKIIDSHTPVYRHEQFKAFIDKE